MVSPARSDAFAALGDAHRRAIVTSLSRGEKSVQEYLLREIQSGWREMGQLLNFHRDQPEQAASARP